MTFDKATIEKTLDRLLSKLTGPNRHAILDYVRQKRAYGLRPNSLWGIANSLRSLDDYCGRVPFHDLTEENLRTALEHYAAEHAENTTQTWATIVRGYFRWTNDDVLPRHVQRGLRRRRIVSMSDYPLVERRQLESLLDAAEQWSLPRNVARDQCLVMMLWDTGMRRHELVRLHLEGVKEIEPGLHELRLDPKHGPFKTGPRTIAVSECSTWLNLWLRSHPAGRGANGFLFPRRGDVNQPMTPSSLSGIVRRLSKYAKLQITPHQFRHTRATRAARTGWNEAMLRNYFGWSSRSPMAGHYVHLSQRDLRDTIRRDAGLIGSGPRQLAPAAGEIDSAVVASLQRVLGRLGHQQSAR